MGMGPFPPPGDRPNPGIKLVSPASPSNGRGILYHQDTQEALLVLNIQIFTQYREKETRI